MDAQSRGYKDTMKVIDLRSDTFTQPTAAMRRAMSRAELGDDVFGEDPTVNRLEAIAAERLGKEAALLVVSGTMGNQVAVLTHCPRGSEVILGNEAHMFHYEVGAISALAGAHVRTVPNDHRGMLNPRDVERAIRSDDVHLPPTSLICLENTHNRCNGAALTPKDMATIAEKARGHTVPLHMDGARIFNAAVALGIDVRDISCYANSVSFCLSKGLSAPVGSVLCGSKEFIARARRNRKMLGGGMRQAGIIAAAGIVALESMVERLADDHTNAKSLAEGLTQIPGVSIDPAVVETNIVFFELTRSPAAELVQRLDREGVKCLQEREGNRIRMVTHYGITRKDIDFALKIVQEAIKG